MSWRFALRKGLGAKQIEVAQLEQAASRIRVFQIAVIPGLLQIAEYASQVMRLSDVTGQLDLERGISLRVQRQAILYEPGRQFQFLITEAAALSRFCDPGIVVRQLDRLRSLGELPNVTIGVIPNRISLPRIPQLSFQVFDSSTAVVETLSGEFNTHEVEVYNQVFDDFSSVALVGTDADIFLEWCKQQLRTHDQTPLHESASERSAGNEATKKPFHFEVPVVRS